MTRMENFISGVKTVLARQQTEMIIQGYPGCEFQIREVLAETIGEQKAEFFFDKVCTFANVILYHHLRAEMQFLEYFFAEPDAEFFKSLGLNCIRIAVNYRHFEGTFPSVHGISWPRYLTLCFR